MELELQFEKIKNQVKIRGGQVWISHNSVCDGRRGTVVILKIGTEEYMGDAYCSLDDMFSKKKGRSIAIGRAWKKYLGRNSSDEMTSKPPFRYMIVADDYFNPNENQKRINTIVIPKSVFDTIIRRSNGGVSTL